MTAPTITALPTDRVGEAATAMTDAFMDDPAFVHILPHPDHRRAGLTAILTVALIDTAPVGHARAVWQDGRVVAVAIWQPPGRYPMSGRRRLRAIPRMLSLGARIGGDVRRMARLGDALDARFPDHPVWYLQALAVHPDHQGSGFGGALLREGLKRADEQSTDVYLETGNVANVAYYQREGFALLDQPDEVFPGGPPMWLMRRPARPPTR